jgi:dolichol-phosphate mannosyltransferase
VVTDLISVILPTYNESVNVPILVERLEKHLEGLPFEIIIVDDNSPDETWKVAQELARSRSHLRVLRRMNEKGLSSAVLRGFEAAIGKVLVVMDSDLQHDETVIRDFIKEIENGSDIVVGSRKAPGGGIEGWSWTRRFLSWGAGLMAKVVLWHSVSDPMSGFFALRRSVFEQYAALINPRGFKILLEFVARAKGQKISEVGYTFRSRMHGESKLSASVMLDYITALYELRFGRYLPARFLKYALVGMSGVLVNFIALYFGKSILGLSESHALMAAIEVSIISNFLLNNFWTFRAARLEKTLPLVRGLLTFNAICLAGALINYSIAMFFRTHFETSLYLANLLGISLATCWNYIINSNITWTAARP